MTIGINLFVPGAAPMTADMAAAMGAPALDPAGAEIAALVRGLCADLRPLFGTADAQVALVPGTAMAAWDVALNNTLAPGDTVLIADTGASSAALIRMAQGMGLTVITATAAPGQGAPERAIDRILGADKDDAVKAVIVPHVETATGAVTDIPAIRRALDSSFHDALLMVDGVSSVGAMPFEMDGWGVDLTVTAGNRALGMPAGLAMIAVGRQALKAARRTPRRGWFDLTAALTEGRHALLPQTLLNGLRVALDRLSAEGLATAFSRHRRLAAMAEAAAGAWGLDATSAPTVTVLRLPSHIDAGEVRRISVERYATAFGAGHGADEPFVIRIAHTGTCREADLLSAIAVAELAMSEAGVRIRYGSGTAAAQTVIQPPRELKPELRFAAE